MSWTALGLVVTALGAAGAAGVAPDAAGPGTEGGVTVDLSDSWTPRTLSDDAALGDVGRQPYREEFVRLADRPNLDERFLELYGIPPSFGLLASRLGDEARHRCRDAATRAAAAGTPRAATAEAVRGAQAELRCEGLLEGRVADGALDAATVQALRLFQRENAIIAGGPLDAETRAALATDSRELDFRAVLRALRERVADATGVIEDGSAAGRRGTVLGRALDCREIAATDRLPALPGAAPDRLSPLTEAAARALGWTDPAATLAYFRRLGPGGTRALRVRLPLDPPPAYHGPDMELRAEIVTGGRRPELRLIARIPDGAEVVLVRWPTTKGGWEAEKTASDGVVMRFKRSAVGAFVWRDLITAPAWFPPETTPDEELVRRDPGGGYRANREAIGPGYRSAYGLLMLVHHKPPIAWDPEQSGPLTDAQTRTHGTANLRSVLHGASHGCHRLHSFRALRLGSFLLAHRKFVRRGPIAERYRRVVVWRGRRYRLAADTRGYLFELTPPVPVRVTTGS
jgi:hypothetical protein